MSGLVVGGLFFLVGHGSLHWAEQYVGSGLAALLIATEPMFILVLAWSMGQQKISRLSALGLGLGVVGVAILTGVELTLKGSSLLGSLAVLLGSLSWSAGVVWVLRNFRVLEKARSWSGMGIALMSKYSASRRLLR